MHTTDLDSQTLTEAIELLFFGYRDFVGEPDTELAKLGLGRAHHRVIHFVGRHPGITVADLLSILRITKQSLGRVLKELVERGYVLQETGPRDRRQRLLYLTHAGQDLERQIARLQHERVGRAIEAAGPHALETWRAILVGLIDPENRQEVERLVRSREIASRWPGGE